MCKIEATRETVGPLGAPSIDELRPHGGDIDAAVRMYVKALDTGADLAQWRSLMRLWSVFAQVVSARTALRE